MLQSHQAVVDAISSQCYFLWQFLGLLDDDHGLSSKSSIDVNSSHSLVTD